MSSRPFSVGELNARVEAVLRRVNVPKTDGASAPLRLGDLQIDFERHEVRVKGKLTRLAPKEFAILQLLLEANAKCSRAITCLSEFGPRQRHGDRHAHRRSTHRSPASQARHTADRVATVTNFGYQIKR